MFIDLKQAFDSVWTDNLIRDIQALGIRGRMLLWLTNFLKNRSFRVRFDGHLSNSKDKLVGIPQGTVLSPLLFALYLNDIDKIIPEGVNIALYADDIVLWTTNPDDHRSAFLINEALRHLRLYLQQKRLFISLPKTKAVLFSKCRAATLDRRNLRLIYGDETIEIVQSIRYLGLQLDRRLTFDEHIRQVTSKTYSRLGIIRMLTGSKWGLTLQQLRQIYLATGQALSEYGCSVWYRVLSGRSWKALNSLQNRALNLITGTPRSAPIAALEAEANISPTKLRLEEKTVRRYEKAMHLGDSPLKKKLDLVSMIPEQELRVWKKRKNLHDVGTTSLLKVPALHQREPTPSVPGNPLYLGKRNVSFQYTQHDEAELEHLFPRHQNLRVW
ncbi:MAG: hypothetical protein GY696_38400, partial [Gammaproteobacteria bacterium]|nr:hypothetical protein [Gammaproteobacteria bacterium]